MSVQMRTLIAALFLSTFASTSGCSNAKDEPTYPYPDLATFCNGRAKAECNKDVVAQCLTTVDVCIAKAQVDCTGRAPSGKYRPQAAEACLAMATSVYGDAKIDAKEIKQLEDVCSLVHGGTGAKGQSCTSNLNCDLDQELRCVVKPGASAGSCQVPVLLGIGEDCAPAEAKCKDDEQYCDTNSNACIKKKDTGAICGGNKLCKDSLQCVKQTPETADGTCQPKLSAGSVCNSGEECADGLCIKTSTTNQCGSIIILGPSEPSCERYK